MGIRPSAFVGMQRAFVASDEISDDGEKETREVSSSSCRQTSTEGDRNLTCASSFSDSSDRKMVSRGYVSVHAGYSARCA
jgi:hypothetical protein